MDWVKITKPSYLIPFLNTMKNISMFRQLRNTIFLEKDKEYYATTIIFSNRQIYYLNKFYKQPAILT